MRGRLFFGSVLAVLASAVTATWQLESGGSSPFGFGGIQQQQQQQQQGSSAAAPVTKIVEALQNLERSVQDEAQKDQMSYKAFYDWCNSVFTAQKTSQDRYVSIQAELQSKLTVQQAMNKQLKDEATQLEQETGEAKQTIEQAASMPRTSTRTT
jgi:hypothetical protein